MTQPNNNPAVPLTDFVDSVFCELSSHGNKWNPHEEGYGFFDNPDCWKDPKPSSKPSLLWYTRILSTVYEIDDEENRILRPIFFFCQFLLFLHQYKNHFHEESI